MASGIATGNHIKIGGKVGVHVAAVCLVIGNDLSWLESCGATGIYNGFRKKPETLVSQKQFVGVILNGKSVTNETK